jgi:hypothetical protein
MKRSALIFHPEIDAEIRQGRNWYRDIAPVLQDAFRDSLIAAFQQIERFPLMYAEVEVGIRRVNLARFPYQVLYYPDGTRIYVLGLQHSHADPESIRKRLASRKPISGHGEPGLN